VHSIRPQTEAGCHWQADSHPSLDFPLTIKGRPDASSEDDRLKFVGGVLTERPKRNGDRNLGSDLRVGKVAASVLVVERCER